MKPNVKENLTKTQYVRNVPLEHFSYTTSRYLVFGLREDLAVRMFPCTSESTCKETWFLLLICISFKIELSGLWGC